MYPNKVIRNLANTFSQHYYSLKTGPMLLLASCGSKFKLYNDRLPHSDSFKKRLEMPFILFSLINKCLLQATLIIP